MMPQNVMSTFNWTVFLNTMQPMETGDESREKKNHQQLIDELQMHLYIDAWPTI